MPNRILPKAQNYLLFSGGIDSTVLLSYLLAKKIKPKCVYVDYGSKGTRHELKAANYYGKKHGLKIDVLEFGVDGTFGSGEVPARNLFLVAAALLAEKVQSGMVFIGVHAGTRYFDCSEEFINLTNKILDGYSGGKIKLLAPFAKWEKKTIFEYAKSKKISLEKTYSCENGKEYGCGKCLSCLDREALEW